MIAQGKPFGVLFTDLDEFGAINKKYGQPAGDEVLMQAALRITEQLREQEETGRERDIVFRIGGDESAIVLPGVENRENLRIVADKIRTSIQSVPFDLPYRNVQVPLSVSIGGAVWEGGKTGEFMDHVGQHLVEAKSERDTVSVK